MRRFFTATVLTLAFFGAFVLASDIQAMAETASTSTTTPVKAKAKHRLPLIKSKKAKTGVPGAPSPAKPM